MHDHDKILLEHILQTLPTDIHKRRALLNALANRLDRKSDAMESVLSLLAGIDQHLNQLRELALGGEGRVS